MIRRLTVALLAVAACGTDMEPHPSRGAELFETPAASLSPRNRFSCASCHATSSGARTEILPGAPLAGVTARLSYWGGAELDLRRAINFCRAQFMTAPEPWSSTDPDAVALYVYLTQLSLPDIEPVPFTVVQEIKDLPAPSAPGDGASIYLRACKKCHGERGTGDGALLDAAPHLPDGPLATHAVPSPADRRLLFIEKVRHGSFLGYQGLMPPFSQETLGDAELAQLLDWFGFY